MNTTPRHAVKSINSITLLGVDATGEAQAGFEELDTILNAIETLSESDTKRAAVLARIGRNLVHEWSGVNDTNAGQFREQEAALKASGVWP